MIIPKDDDSVEVILRGYGAEERIQLLHSSILMLLHSAAEETEHLQRMIFQDDQTVECITTDRETGSQRNGDRLQIKNFELIRSEMYGR